MRRTRRLPREDVLSFERLLRELGARAVADELRELLTSGLGLQRP